MWAKLVDNIKSGCSFTQKHKMTYLMCFSKLLSLFVTSFSFFWTLTRTFIFLHSLNIQSKPGAEIYVASRLLGPAWLCYTCIIRYQNPGYSVFLFYQSQIFPLPALWTRWRLDRAHQLVWKEILLQLPDGGFTVGEAERMAREVAVIISYATEWCTLVFPHFG